MVLRSLAVSVFIGEGEYQNPYTATRDDGIGVDLAAAPLDRIWNLLTKPSQTIRR